MLGKAISFLVSLGIFRLLLQILGVIKKKIAGNRFLKLGGEGNIEKYNWRIVDFEVFDG